MAEHRDPRGRPKWHKRLSRLVVKHKVLVTLLSSATVLASFIVKEALDEPAEDLLNRIALVEESSNHAQDNLGVWNVLSSIKQDTNAMRGKVVGDVQADDSESPLGHLRTDRFNALSLIGNNMEALHYLLNVLPPSFRQQETQFEQDYQNLLEQSGAAGGTASLTALEQYASQWQTISDRCRNLLGEGMEHTETLRARTERDHEIYLWLTYISFGLGWLVGLGSSLAGGKPATADG